MRISRSRTERVLFLVTAERESRRVVLPGSLASARTSPGPNPMQRLLLSLLFAGACLPACFGGAEQDARERLELQAERYETLILERERQWVSRVHNGMQKLLLIEAERSRTEEERTSLALKLEDRIERFNDGVRAIALRLKYHGESEFRPFIASWSVDGGEIQRVVTGDARIPEAVRAALEHYEGETTFTSGTGADDERSIQVHIYYSIENLERRIQAIRR